MLAMAVGAGMLAFGRMTYLNDLPATVNDAAATAFFDQFTVFLKQSLWAGAAAGLVLFLGGLLMGTGKVATGIRSVPVKAAAAIQGWLASLGLQMNGDAHLGRLAGDRAADRGGPRSVGVRSCCSATRRPS